MLIPLNIAETNIIVTSTIIVLLVHSQRTSENRDGQYTTT